MLFFHYALLNIRLRMFRVNCSKHCIKNSSYVQKRLQTNPIIPWNISTSAPEAQVFDVL